MTATMQPLPLDGCLRRLAQHVVGRIAFTGSEGTVILPVNYQLFDLGPEPAILVRTRPGSAIYDAPFGVAFEIDGVDAVHRAGWSVLIRGGLRHLSSVEEGQLGDRIHLSSWLGPDRSVSLVIVPLSISGRRLVDSDDEWRFDVGAHL